MPLPDYAKLIRNTVKTVMNPQFEKMKLNVTHLAWVGNDGAGTDIFDPGGPVTRRALVDLTRREFRVEGVQVQTVATLYFLDPIPDNGAAERQEPIDTRDIITLPNGVTAPIRTVGGFADSKTSQPFVYKVILGVLRSGR